MDQVILQAVGFEIDIFFFNNIDNANKKGEKKKKHDDHAKNPRVIFLILFQTTFGWTIIFTKYGELFDERQYIWITWCYQPIEE